VFEKASHWPLLAALGSFLAALGSFLAALGRSWGAFGRSWAPLGRSWAALGRSWAALGRSWAALGTTCKNHQKIDAKNDRFGPPKASQKPPKMTPNRTKKRPKIDAKNELKKTPLQDRPGTVLGQTKRQSFRKKLQNARTHTHTQALVKIHFFQKISFQEPP